MQASEQTFSKIIQSENGNEHYHVPKYQRAYSWRQHNWAHLFDDIDDNEAGHFIGSIICIRDTSKQQPGHDTIFELIDGQQRMTTLSLLTAALYKKINHCLEQLSEDDDYDEEDLDEFKAKRRGLGLQLVRKVRADAAEQTGTIRIGRRSILLRVQPSSQNLNLNDYLYNSVRVRTDCESRLSCLLWQPLNGKGIRLFSGSSAR